MKNRDTIPTATEAEVSQLRIRLLDGNFPVLEKALIKWMQLICSLNVPIGGNFLKEKPNLLQKNECRF